MEVAFTLFSLADQNVLWPLNEWRIVAQWTHKFTRVFQYRCLDRAMGRFGMATARVGINAEMVFNLIEDPLFIIDGNRNVLFQNLAAKVSFSGIGYLSLRDGRLTLMNAAANAQLDRLLLSLYCASATSDMRRGGGLRLIVTPDKQRSKNSASKDWLLSLHILTTVPVVPAAFIVHLVRRIGKRRLPKLAIQELFSLTTREMQVVEHLVGGASLRSIAELVHLSHESVRVYLKRIFRKCEVHSQADLIALVHRLSLFAPE